MKAKAKYLLLITVIFGYLHSCAEKERYEISAGSTTPPGTPQEVTWKSMPGGVRFYYTVPRDRDVLAVKAEYVNERGKTLSFSTSFFNDSLDVFGFADTVMYDVKLFAVNRAGLPSKEQMFKVKPQEGVLNMVAQTLTLKRSFNSLLVEWENALKWEINVLVTLKYQQNGVQHEILRAFNSKLEQEVATVPDLNGLDNNELEVLIRITDIYENITKLFSYGKIMLLTDDKLDKRKMYLPAPNDSIGGVPQLFGNLIEGNNEYLIDDLINDEIYLTNFIHTGNQGEALGRTGRRGDGNDWNVLIDLNGYYELSRCQTHQRWSGSNENPWGEYFGGINGTSTGNVGRFAMYVLNEDVDPPQWEFCSERYVQIPQKGTPGLEVLAMGRAGDMAHFFPREPQYTRPTRYFRYEKLGDFVDLNNKFRAGNLSEITLYGRTNNAYKPKYPLNRPNKN
jgi:hypothetical protein